MRPVFHDGGHVQLYDCTVWLAHGQWMHNQHGHSSLIHIFIGTTSLAEEYELYEEQAKLGWLTTVSYPGVYV